MVFAGVGTACLDDGPELGPPPVGAWPVGASPAHDHDQGPQPVDSEPATRDPAGVQSRAGFSWVSPKLAGLRRPGSAGELDEDLTFIAARGVDVLVSLTPTPIPVEDVHAHGMTAQHIPVPDFTAPTQDQFDAFLALLRDAQANDTRIAVHCQAGIGRTGTMLAAAFVADGKSAEEALAEIRRLRPGSVETREQEDALAVLAERLHADNGE